MVYKYFSKNLLEVVLKNQKYTHFLYTIFGMLVYLICTYSANLIEDFVFYCVTIVNAFQKILENLIANQTKYG